MSTILHGIMLFVVVMLIAFVIAMVAKSAKEESGHGINFYDERQKIERGKGYQAGFFSMVIYFLVYGMLESVVGIVWCETLIGVLIGICIGILVFVGYCIWKEAYVTANENLKSRFRLFALIGLMNLILGVSRGLDGELITDHKLNQNSINLIIGIVFIGLCIIFAAKQWKDKKEA